MDYGKSQIVGDSVAAEAEEALLRGVIRRFSFRNEDTGFSVLRLSPESTAEPGYQGPDGLVALVGVVPDSIRVGSWVVARGTWQIHPRFGRQFRSRSLVETEPGNAAAILRYLSSGALKGLGPVLAERVVSRFGDETLKMFDNHPERLLDVPGIGPRKLDEILADWQAKRDSREVMLFFQQYGISLALARRIHRHYGRRAIETVRTNPYVLAEEVWGIGFLTADNIAKSLGLAEDSPERLVAGLRYALEKSAEDGHCYLEKGQLLERAAALLLIDDSTLLEAALSRAALAGSILVLDSRVYLPSLYRAEISLSRIVAAFLERHSQPAKPIPEHLVDSILSESIVLEQASSASNQALIGRLSPEQQSAVRLASEQSLLVITGGPGCGKTTVLRTIARLFRRAGLDVRLAAPTGRAAQRLQEVCDMQASTIHRLLRVDPASGAFVHGRDEPLALDALILDESSMIDLPLAASLFEALPLGVRVVIVGDRDQLPSVGPGRFFADLLSLSQVKRVRLTTLFRRAAQSAITQAAHAINRGELPEIPEPDGSIRSDAYFLPAREPEKAASLLERLIVEQIPKKFQIPSVDIMLLTPMNKGPLGAVTLNRRLQSLIVPAMAGLPTLSYGDLDFRIGDRIIQRVNNYNITAGGVFNGDRGEVIGIDAVSRSLYVRLWDGREVEYRSDDLGQLDLAYAMTVHRSQGSEVPAVVLVLHQSHHILLERQLVYTGVTRAKKLLVVVGTRKALEIAARRSQAHCRQTTLAHFIAGNLSPGNSTG